ncbi:MAG: hypothetical protein K5767_06190 [Clostridia bacterium]|nr:hypothetical protein [Clostridia bacterium]
MLRIDQLKLKMNEPVSALPSKIAKALRMKDLKITEWKVVRESVDARKKPDIRFNYTVDFTAADEKRLLEKASKIRGVSLKLAPDRDYHIHTINGDLPEEQRPVIAGLGPCGLFAALILAEAGARPIVLERGRSVEQRTADVEHFWETGELDPSSNVQFGEGGAGTFSDGKLTTGIKDPRIAKVNDEFIQAGADPSIAYSHLPHIGTDVLREVVKNIREKIISLGGEVRFESQLTGLIRENDRLAGIEIKDSGSGTTSRMACRQLILAPGNSARDTFEMLHDSGIKLEPKPFSVGVRIEHPQVLVDESQYGVERNDSEGRLSAAAYKLSHHCEDGRGVYTFCMCPGGYVVASSSEPGGVVTNGMSYRARDGKNANSALLVGISPEDYGGSPEDPLAGVRFQRQLERRAFEIGGENYRAPAERLETFISDAASPERVPFSGSPEELSVEPTYRPGVTWKRVSDVLPDFVTDAMREAIPVMAGKLKGFDLGQAVMTAVETRSSSPVRIMRDETGQSVSLQGLYPGGEGAGYAGGIMSAAVDGIRLAEHILAAVGVPK